MSNSANELDFFGGGSADGSLGGIEPQGGEVMTAEQIAELRRKKEAWQASMGLDANGNQLPAYGTPQHQGGTATGWQTTTAPTIGTGEMTGVTAQTLNPYTGAVDVGGTTVGYQWQRDAGVGTGAAGATVDPRVMTNSGVGVTAGPQLATKGSMLTHQTSGETLQLRDKLAADQQLAIDEFGLAADQIADMNPMTNRGLTSTAAEQARNALGPAPTIDQGLADRARGQVTQAVQQAGQVVGQALTPIGQKGLDKSVTAARSVLDQALMGPDTTARIGAQTLRNQLALARSASGGAGGVQEAMRNAQFAAPEMLSQASDAGIREQQAKLGIASQQTGQLTQAELGRQQNQNQRLATAAQAAGVSAQAAQGARGQDIEIAKSNQEAANNLLNNVNQLTGGQLQLNQQNQELLGQMARDLAAQQFDWSKLDAQTQDAEFERWVKTYGIDVAAAAQIKAAAENNDKGVMDYLMPIIGGVATAII
jgi:hypothetical protein